MSCPFPTAVECNCLSGFALAGFSGSDTATYSNVMDENTVQRYHLTGEWVGVDAIVEYMSSYGGEFMSPLESLGDNVLDLSASTPELCVLASTGPTRVRTVADVSVDGVSACIDFSAANLLKYELTGDADKPILMTEWDVWTPDELIPALFNPLDSVATAEFMCDVIVNVCGGDDTPKKQKKGKKGKSRKLGKKGKKLGKKGKAGKSEKGKVGKSGKKGADPMVACSEEYYALPANDDGFWIDGDSRHCRILHGGYAATNPTHCPHVSFEKEMDVNGKIKCYESKGITAEDIFSAEQIEFFKTAPLPYSTDNPFFAAYADGSCPDLN